MKRKRIISIIFVGIFIAVMLAGCSKASDTLLKAHEPQENIDTITEQDGFEQNEKEVDEVPADKGIAENMIDFKIMDLSMMTEGIAAEIEILKLTRGYYYWQQEDGSYLIFIGAGEKSTGGYGIEVVTVEDKEGKTVISVLETEPDSDSMTIQILTYPYVIIKVAGITDQFIIKDQNQAEYPIITEITLPQGDDLAGGARLADGPIDYSKPIQGIYQGQADNHTIEVVVGDIYTSFYADEIDRFLKGIEIGDSVEIMVEIAPSDQIILTDLVKLYK